MGAMVFVAFSHPCNHIVNGDKSCSSGICLGMVWIRAEGRRINVTVVLNKGAGFVLLCNTAWVDARVLLF
jgi:hypothetical protein